VKDEEPAAARQWWAPRPSISIRSEVLVEPEEVRTISNKFWVLLETAGREAEAPLVLCLAGGWESLGRGAAFGQFGLRSCIGGWRRQSKRTHERLNRIPPKPLPHREGAALIAPVCNRCGLSALTASQFRLHTSFESGRLAPSCRRLCSDRLSARSVRGARILREAVSFVFPPLAALRRTALESKRASGEPGSRPEAFTTKNRKLGYIHLTSVEGKWSKNRRTGFRAVQLPSERRKSPMRTKAHAGIESLAALGKIRTDCRRRNQCGTLEIN
jgi:hypothetical protein